MSDGWVDEPRQQRCGFCGASLYAQTQSDDSVGRRYAAAAGCVFYDVRANGSGAFGGPGHPEIPRRTAQGAETGASVGPEDDPDTDDAGLPVHLLLEASGAHVDGW